MISSLRESRWLTPLARFTATFFTFACIPPSLYAYDPSKPREVNPPAPSTVLSRELTESEMESLSGRTGNPYNAGQAKFDIVFQGINTRTLNFTTAGSDLSFEGGYGIPVAVTRSYSANNIDEGPLGPGWTISTDIRSSAGGLLKSPKAPDRSVPVDIRRRPTTEIDPNRSTQPVEAVTVTDSGGSQSTIQRDVDGVLTTAPWEKNQYEAEYEPVTQSGNTYWVMTENKTITPDGTTYHYIKTGEYLNGGSRPWNNNSATPEPNNVLKPATVSNSSSIDSTEKYLHVLNENLLA
ncbi:MAG: DUF6531 domain-containing protein [Fimbriimonadaceae bacterium]|nr:DUF6531 domain-containing protein [Fimbriimonadaceae bacterium]